MKLVTTENSINVTVRNSPKAKYVRIKISAARGVELIIPRNVSEKKAFKFLQSKELWIINHLNKLSVQDNQRDDEILLYGKTHKIIHSDTKIESLIMIEDGAILFSKTLKKSDIPTMLTAYLKQILKNDIVHYCELISKKLDVSYKKVSLKDTKGQWGSCSRTGNLSFSWRLIFAPKFVIEYLVAHELSHLIERNHSSRFWKVVARVYPEFKIAKSWLRKNGRLLHSYLK